MIKYVFLYNFYIREIWTSRTSYDPLGKFNNKELSQIENYCLRRPPKFQCYNIFSKLHEYWGSLSHRFVIFVLLNAKSIFVKKCKFDCSTDFSTLHHTILFLANYNFSFILQTAIQNVINSFEKAKEKFSDCVESYALYAQVIHAKMIITDEMNIFYNKI